MLYIILGATVLIGIIIYAANRNSSGGGSNSSGRRHTGKPNRGDQK